MLDAVAATCLGDVVGEVVDIGVDDVGGVGDHPQDVYGGVQRGELALAPHVGGQEAGFAGYRAAQETGSAATLPKARAQISAGKSTKNARSEQ